MISIFAYVIRYFKYLIKAQGIGHLHSPFLFTLANEVIYNKTPFYVFDKLEKHRKLLELNPQKVILTDLGAGSKFANTKEKSIGQIARHSAKKAKYAQLLFRLVQFHQPRHVIELGTSLGMTTLYLSYASGQNKVISIEGDPKLAKISDAQFKRFKRKNIELIQGSFDEHIDAVIKERDPISFIFVDGNHTKEATLKYFEMILQYKNEETVIVFDDIHWSRGMEEAWEQIRRNEEVSLSIDLFELGLVYFMKRPEKEHFVIRF